MMTDDDEKGTSEEYVYGSEVDNSSNQIIANDEPIIKDEISGDIILENDVNKKIVDSESDDRFENDLTSENKEKVQSDILEEDLEEEISLRHPNPDSQEEIEDEFVSDKHQNINQEENKNTIESGASEDEDLIEDSENVETDKNDLKADANELLENSINLEHEFSGSNSNKNEDKKNENERPFDYQKLTSEIYINKVSALKLFNKSERYDDAQSETVEDIFVDPSKPLTKEPSSQNFPFQEEEINVQLELLKTEKVLIVTSLDEKTAYDSARILAFRFDKRKYELRKILAGRGEDVEKLSIDTILKEDIGSGEKMVVVIDVKSSIFFGSIISSEYSHTLTIKEVLRDKNIFLILSISSELWIEDIKERGKSFFFKNWHIPLESQPELTIEKKTTIQNLIQDNESIKKIIVYTISFFPGLNQEDFEQIVKILLYNSKIRNKKKEKLKNKWLERPDLYLKKSEVVKIYSENYDSDIFDFKESSQRITLKQYFNETQSFYIKQKFDSLFESGLLFQLGTNSQVINNLINLIIKKLSSNTKEYSVRYLHKLTKGILDTSNITFNNGAPTVEEMVDRLFEINKRVVFFDNSLSILSQLIDEMLSNSKLKEAVNSYLNAYMDRHRRVVVQKIMEKLKYSLNFDKFYWVGRLLNEGDKSTRDKSYNFLINFSKQLGARVFDLLEKISTWLPHPETPVTNFSPVNLYGLSFIIDFLNEITEKFPISKFGNFPSNYSLFITFDKESNSTPEKINLIVSWLFHPALENALVLLRRIHSENQNTNIKKVKREFLQFKAHQIEVWYAILLWNINDKNLTSKEFDNLNFVAIQIINKVYIHTPKNDRRMLDEIWESKSKYYAKLSADHLNEISRIKKNNSPQRKQLLDNRSLVLKSFAIVNRLQNEFKKMIIQNK